jgi:hypothetical protein
MTALPCCRRERIASLSHQRLKSVADDNANISQKRSSVVDPCLFLLPSLKKNKLVTVYGARLRPVFPELCGCEDIPGENFFIILR